MCQGQLTETNGERRRTSQAGPSGPSREGGRKKGVRTGWGPERLTLMAEAPAPADLPPLAVAASRSCRSASSVSLRLTARRGGFGAGTRCRGWDRSSGIGGLGSLPGCPTRTTACTNQCVALEFFRRLTIRLVRCVAGEEREQSIGPAGGAAAG